MSHFIRFDHQMPEVSTVTFEKYEHATGARVPRAALEAMQPRGGFQAQFLSMIMRRRNSHSKCSRAFGKVKPAQAHGTFRGNRLAAERLQAQLKARAEKVAEAIMKEQEA